MPSRVSYSPSYAWLHNLLRPLRLPIVFLLSGLTSFCAFKDGNALVGSGPVASGAHTEKVVLWDADLMPRGERLKVRKEMSQTFGENVNPDVLVLYDVPNFTQLLELRDALGLYGYTAVMSNFFCGRPSFGMTWPLEVAVLSRYPISDATQFDAPGTNTAGCKTQAPYIQGPVVRSRARLKIPAAAKWRWPRLGGKSLPGPGLLTVRIGSINTAIVAVRVPAASEYPGASTAALNAMRMALAARARAWMVTEIEKAPDTRVFAMGDFGLGAKGKRLQAAGVMTSDDADQGDAVDELMSPGTAVAKAVGGHVSNLTRALSVEGLAAGVHPHSDRIYVWTNGPQRYGNALRAANSYGSRAFPLVVRSSGASCTADPRLMRYRLSPAIAGMSKQFFVVSGTGLERQLAAFRRARGNKDGWVASIDVDGLLIDNSPFLTAIAQQCREPSVKDWQTWFESDQPKLMPGAATFMRELRARAARDDGQILLLTARKDGLRDAMVATLKRLGVLASENDGLVEVERAATLKARHAIWTRATADGARLALVLGTRADQFPSDPALRVGGSARSCPDDPKMHAHPLDVLGPEAAHFGHCFFLLPVHVL